MISRRSTWNFHTAGRLLFGNGAIQQLGEVTARLKVQRAMLITDAGLVKAGAVSKAQKPLEDANITVSIFDGGEPEPSLDVVQLAVDASRDFNPDVIVGIGGGSNMDLAKSVALLLTHGGTIHNYLGVDKVSGPVLPLICIPTTAGTGSEVSSAVVLTDKANKVKVAAMSQYLRPAIALVDPELTLTCPKGATADSGIDALTHAVESYLATDYTEIEAPPGEIAGYEGRHLIGDCFAERTIELVGKHLITAVNEPDNLKAREGMALAATVAGMSFSNCGVGLVHAMEYPMGPVLHCSHGGGNGLLLPYVMKYEMPTRMKELGRIAQLLGEDVSGLGEEEAAQLAIDAVARLRDAIGIPGRIRDLGGSEDQLPGFASIAFNIKRLMHLTPRPTTEADVLEVYRSAF